MQAVNMDDAKILQDALDVVKAQSVLMKRSLDADQIMEALKSTSTMLAELRTSSLTPKQYYELYMSVFDALRHLTTYLYDAHASGKHHLADLYELVQYAGNIVPRLYLMITVGSVYMSFPDAPVKEVMKDMLEMTRGVQHATRGLFLRHYLSGQTRDYLPVGTSDGIAGNLQDSIAFILTNFVEMNKLWVRLQHQGHSKEREKREMERKELRILVGTNLVRLSQLEGVDLTMYRQVILPSILEQVVGCKEVIAQEYLMEVIIQVFSDEFHLHSLDAFMSATAQLHPKVNVKQIVISLIDRLAAYSAREAEDESPESRKKHEEESKRRLAEQIKAIRKGKGKADSIDHETRPQSPALITPNPDGPEESQDLAKVETKDETSISPTKTSRGIPANVPLFEIFWQQVVRLVSVRQDLAIQDITALLVSLLNLALNCYPDRLDYVNHLLMFTKQKLDDHATNPDLLASTTTTNLLSLLLAPVNSYSSVLTLLALPSYQAMLSKQPAAIRISIGRAIVASILRNDTHIESVEDVDGILLLCQDLIQDTPKPEHPQSRSLQSVAPHELQAIAEEQGWLARIVHLIVSDDDNTQIALLRAARNHFARGGQRIRYTYPALVAAALKVARMLKSKTSQDDKDGKDTKDDAIRSVLKLAHQTTLSLYNQVEASEISLRLCLSAAQMAGECDLEDLAYEFYVQAFVVYEESISESNTQLDTITAIMSHLQTSRIFGADNYDTLITKAALHGSKLLKKTHQAVAVLQASHMWWQGDLLGEDLSTIEPLRDDKRVLECLQKSLRIASSCVDEVSSVQLYVEALDKYIYYFEQGVGAVSAKYINSLTELIVGNIDSVATSDDHVVRHIDRSRGTWDIVQHFRNTLEYMRRQQEHGDKGAWQDVELMGALRKMSIA